MLKANVDGLIGNSFAIIRPPGHHSYSNQPQAYCIFNTIAIIAKYAVEKLHLKRVLIIDIDYHCGNGTYQSLKNDDRFLFVNFHAYHYGASWPFDSEYDYDSSATNHISIPLNAAMNNEFDYMAALHIIVIPLAKEFAPELVLISAGFDSAYCDQIVELDDFGQAIKAHGYGHFARLLDKHWPNKVLAILEGGYLPESYAECASQLTRGLQGAPLPNIAYQKSINICMIQTIWNALCHHSKRWKSAAVMLSKLQEQQIQNKLSIYIPPTERIFVGHKFRLIWNRIKEFRIARTREWIQLDETIANDGSKYNDAVNRINAYITGAPLPNIAYQKSINICMIQTIWNALCHHSKRWKSAAVMLSKLQEQQIQNKLSIYIPPTERIFVGHKFRLIWNRIKEFRIARTREWIQLDETIANDGSKYNDAVNRINAYITDYDYTSQCDNLNEETFIERMLWTHTSASEAFLLSAPATLYFYTGMEQCLKNDASKYLIIDMATLKDAERNISK
uniref:Hist_deacetyl domain-containing protein n=1 Tax=Ascaris lumbricoides TaxID=6252 RepID=A0A0M3I814_ASCLU